MPEPDRMSQWLADGRELFLGTVARLADTDLAEPTLLPGWSRAHVLAHMARSADALGNLVTWARTGIETPMYASGQRRAADIEIDAAQPPAQLRADMVAADARFTVACAQLPAAAWDVMVRTHSGRIVPASEVLWVRVREVWIHAVDLD